MSNGSVGIDFLLGRIWRTSFPEKEDVLFMGAEFSVATFWDISSAIDIYRVRGPEVPNLEDNVFLERQNQSSSVLFC